MESIYFSKGTLLYGDNVLTYKGFNIYYEVYLIEYSKTKDFTDIFHRKITDDFSVYNGATGYKCFEYRNFHSLQEIIDFLDIWQVTPYKC